MCELKEYGSYTNICIKHHIFERPNQQTIDATKLTYFRHLLMIVLNAHIYHKSTELMYILPDILYIEMMFIKSGHKDG